MRFIIIECQGCRREFPAFFKDFDELIGDVIPCEHCGEPHQIKPSANKDEYLVKRMRMS